MKRLIDEEIGLIHMCDEEIELSEFKEELDDLMEEVGDNKFIGVYMKFDTDIWDGEQYINVFGRKMETDDDLKKREAREAEEQLKKYHELGAILREKGVL